MIDHVAYVVWDLRDDRIQELVDLLGLREFEADEEYKQAFMEGYKARWFHDETGETSIHLVQHEADTPGDRGLEHICFKYVGGVRYERCRRSRLCVRDSGSGRIWLEACGLRVEVHP